MSKYTTEVRYICEKYAGYDESKEYPDVKTIIDNSWEKIFDFDFPIFDEDYKPVLCKKIIKHYYTREIGLETVALWKLKLDTLMNEIMPYYNKLYESELLRFDPFRDADYTKTHEGSDSGNGTDTGNSSRTGAGTHTGTIEDEGTHSETTGDVGHDELTETTWDIYSDTPQGALTNVENETYLTNAEKTTHTAERDNTNDREVEGENANTRTFNDRNDTTESANSTLRRVYDNTNEYVDHVVGKFPGKSYPQLLKEFRETLLNIDMDIIADLGELFMKLW